MAQTNFITSQYVCVHQKAATVLQRFCAFLLDLVFMNICLMVLGMILGLLARYFFNSTDTWFSVNCPSALAPVTYET